MDLEWIRRGLEKPGKSQRGLAEALGIDPAGVTRLLQGKRQLKAAEIDKISRYLDEQIPTKASAVRTEKVELVPLSTSPFGPDEVPIYGYAAAGADDALHLANGDEVGRVLRHPRQRGVAGAFAVYVVGESMLPRYRPGEVVYLIPGRVPPRGDDCVIALHNGDGYLKLFEGWHDGVLQCGQFNPPDRKWLWRADEVLAVHSVCGRG